MLRLHAFLLFPSVNSSEALPLVSVARPGLSKRKSCDPADSADADENSKTGVQQQIEVFGHTNGGDDAESVQDDEHKAVKEAQAEDLPIKVPKTSHSSA
jgi:hypothetical protein